jgi:hypothetical protein
MAKGKQWFFGKINDNLGIVHHEIEVASRDGLLLNIDERPIIVFKVATISVSTFAANIKSFVMLCTKVFVKLAIL